MISALDRKLVRDLGRLRGQVITISLVVASGIAAYVALEGTYASLVYSRDAYYDQNRFADVFASLKRAPDRVEARIAAIEGVDTVYTRTVEGVTVPLDELDEPAAGSVVSLPAGRRPLLNDLTLTRGRLVEPGRDDEAVVLESFVVAHDLELGDELPVVVNGTLRQVRVVGVALCPEYVFPMPVAGFFSDAERYVVLWMDEDAVGAAYQMEGAFNDVALTLTPGASEAEVLSQVDRILEPYGAFGAVGRDKQPSNYILSGEMAQLKSFGAVAAFMFLAVAAFLVNVVLSRLVLLQRSQIATLKAVGYGDRAIGLHFLKLVSLIVLAGAVVGMALGLYLGREMVDLYRQFFSFPTLAYRLDARVAMTGVVVSLVSAIAGAAISVWRVMQLPPAEAMRPPPPARYRKTVLERIGLSHFVGPTGRMIVRELERRPLRLLLSSVGIAMAVSIMVVARFSADAIDELMPLQFHEAWREDVTVFYNRPVDARATRDVAHVPGVLHAESLRTVPVRFRNGPRSRDAAILGYPDSMELRRVLDRDGTQQPIPAEGIMLTAKLAEVLGLSLGDEVVVEVREGDRRVDSIPIVALADEPFGLSGHMSADALAGLLREEETVSMSVLRVDPVRYEEVRDRLTQMPAVAGILRKDNLIRQFREQSADMMIVMTIIMTLLASTIAIGVVYNNARIALSMRSRDLASLRVLGFTRGEISAVLLGELSVQVLLAIPIGLLLGTALCYGMAQTADPEQYRLPVVLSTQTYSFASLVTLAAGLFSALLVRRKLDKLDLIGVLKTRD